MMRLLMWNVISIDGLFEGPSKWDLGFHQTILDAEFTQFANDQLRSASCLLFGRATFDGMAAYWPTATDETARPMNAIPKYVLTSHGAVPAWEHSTIVHGDAVEFVRALKRDGTGDGYVFGSARLSATLLEHGLYDELRLLVAPVILGAGTPLFGAGVGTHRFTLAGTRPMASGGEILRYEPIRGGPA